VSYLSRSQNDRAIKNGTSKKTEGFCQVLFDKDLKLRPVNHTQDTGPKYNRGTTQVQPRDEDVLVRLSWANDKQSFRVARYNDLNKEWVRLESADSRLLYALICDHHPWLEGWMVKKSGEGYYLPVPEEDHERSIYRRQRLNRFCYDFGLDEDVKLASHCRLTPRKLEFDPSKILLAYEPAGVVYYLSNKDGTSTRVHFDNLSRNSAACLDITLRDKMSNKYRYLIKVVKNHSIDIWDTLYNPPSGVL